MQPRIIGWDIETTHLKSSFGHVICCSFVDLLDPKAKVETLRIDDPELAGETPSDDSRLVQAIKYYLEDHWMWAGWYSKLFDLRYIDGRLALNGLPPVERRLHLDLIYFARMLNLHSSRLDAIAKSFEFKNQKTDVLPSTWVKAGEGDAAAINYVVRHCSSDVKLLRDVFPTLAPLIRNVHKG